jgi:hypothetical protein
MEIGMMLLLLGHLADENGRMQRLRKIAKTIGAAENLNGPVFGIGSLHDAPFRGNLLEQRRDLVAGQRRDTAATRHASARSQIAHRRSPISVAISPGRSTIA